MKGYPKFLNTKKDYEYVKSHYSDETWQKEYQRLLETQYMWATTKQLASEKDGVIDETHRVVKQKDEESGEDTFYQQERQTNPLGKIFRIGYTVEEVEAILA